MSATTAPAWTKVRQQPGALARLFDNKAFLIIICLLPAVGLLMTFLTYPLGLGVYLAFTDQTIGRRGIWIDSLGKARDRGRVRRVPRRRTGGERRSRRRVSPPKTAALAGPSP